MKKNKKILDYIKNFSRIIDNGVFSEDQLALIIEILKKYKKKNNVHIFGNGGSATIASHFSMDLTNNTSIKCYNYNDPSIITCFANDYKFENWISKTISKYGKRGDLLILISSSGNSKNMLKAVYTAKKMKFYKVVTFTGFSKSNKLKNIGDVNFWVNSKSYNVIESAHNFFLLLLVDLLKK